MSHVRPSCHRSASNVSYGGLFIQRLSSSSPCFEGAQLIIVGLLKPSIGSQFAIDMGFTPNSELELLFDPALFAEIPDLGTDLHIRPLSKTDYQRDHLKVLARLTSAPDTGLANYQARFELLQSINKATPDKPSYSVICIVRKLDDKLVASGTLLLEHKFIRAGGSVGHIEDIVVDPDVRGQNLGRKIITTLTEMSEKLGAYKTILDCNKDNIPFYEKCGYEHKEYEMVRYTPEETLTRYRKKL